VPMMYENVFHLYKQSAKYTVLQLKLVEQSCRSLLIFSQVFRKYLLIPTDPYLSSGPNISYSVHVPLPQGIVLFNIITKSKLTSLKCSLAF
jgi:hypothetical protein